MEPNKNPGASQMYPVASPGGGAPYRYGVYPPHNAQFYPPNVQMAPNNPSPYYGTQRVAHSGIAPQPVLVPYPPRQAYPPTPQNMASSNPYKGAPIPMLSASANPGPGIVNPASNQQAMLLASSAAPLASLPNSSMMQSVPIQSLNPNVVIRSISPPPTPIISGFVVHQDGAPEKDVVIPEPLKNTESQSEMDPFGNFMPNFNDLLSVQDYENSLMIRTLMPHTKVTTTFERKAFDGLLKDLTKKSIQHSLALQTKQEIEQQTQFSHQQLWSFPTIEKKVSGHSMDGQAMVNIIKYKVASLNENHYRALVDSFSKLNGLIFRPVWISLYEQTLYELEISRYVQEVVAGTDKYEDISGLLGVLCDCYKREKASLSPHTLAVLRGLILFVGAKLLQGVEEPKQQDLLSDIFGELSINSTDNQNETDVHTFIIEQLLSIDGCYWAKPLIQPTTQSLSKQYFYKALLSKENITEYDYMSIISQFPWLSIQNLSVSEVENALLLPIQMTIEKLAKEKYLQALLLLVIILLHIYEKFPDLKLTCFGIITRSPWPTKLISTACLNLVKWENFSSDELVIVFSELYQISSISAETYSKLSYSERLSHVDTFVGVLCNGQSVLQQVYNIDKRLSKLNDGSLFPIFNVFMRIAEKSRNLKNLRVEDLRKQTGFDLTKLIIEELFHFAFSWQLNQMTLQTNPAMNNSAPLLKQAAIKALCWLCNTEVQYLSYVIYQVGQNLNFFHHQYANLLNFFSTIKSSTWEKWSPDNHSIDVVCYFLCHRTFSALPDIQHPEYPTSVRNMLIDFVKKQPSPFPQQVSKAASAIGCIMFDSIKISKLKSGLDPIVKIKLLLTLSMAGEFVDPTWFQNSLSTLPTELYNGPFEYILTTHFISLHKFVNFSNHLLVFLQILVAAGLVIDNYTPKDSPLAPQSVFTVRWFSQEGYFNTFNFYAASEGLLPLNLCASKLVQFLEMIRMEPFPEATAWISNILESQIQNPRNSKVYNDTIMYQIIKTLSSFNTNYMSWLKLWERIILTKYKIKQFLPAINLLGHIIFSNQYHLQEMNPNLNLKKNDILGMVSSAPFAAYLGALSFEPRLPPQRELSSLEPPRSVRDSGLWLWRDMGMNQPHFLLALIYWEKFFLLYFEVQSLYGDLHYFPPTWRAELNEHFTKAAKSFDSAKTKPLYQIYYSFTTWSKDIIFTTGNNLFLANNKEVLHIFNESFHPPFLQQKPTTVAPAPGLSSSLTRSQPTPLMDLSQIVHAEDSENLSVLDMLPARQGTPSSFFSIEKAHYQSYMKEFEKNMSEITKLITDPNQNKESIRIPLIDDLEILLDQYIELAKDLKESDETFLRLCRKQYYNHPHKYMSTTPFIAEIHAHKIGPEYPTVVEDMQENRKQYNLHYMTFFDIARSIAHTISIANNMKDFMCSEVNERRAFAIPLFFKLLTLIMKDVCYHSITSKLVDVALELGLKFIAGRPDVDQGFLLRQMLVLPVSFSTDPSLQMVNQLNPSQSVNLLGNTMHSSRSELFQILVPDILHFDEYMRLLKILVSTPTHLTNQEFEQLLQRFKISSVFGQFLENQELNLEEVYGVLSIVLFKPSFAGLSADLVTALVMFGSATNLDRVLELIFHVSDKVDASMKWDSILSSLKKISGQQAHRLLLKIHSMLPLTRKQFSPAISILKTLLLETPLKNQIVTESQSPFDNSESTWLIFSSFFRTSLVSTQLKENDISSLFQLLVSVVQLSPTLVDYVWPLYIEPIFPYLANLELNFIEETEKELVTSYIVSAFGLIPWKDANFHGSNPTVLAVLGAHIDIQPLISSNIFSNLNWISLAEQLQNMIGDNENNGFKIYSEYNIIQFLYLFLVINVLSPTSLPGNLKTLVFGISKSSNWFIEKKYLFDWRFVKSSDWVALFNGNKIVNTLKGGKVKMDPSVQVLEDLELLFAIARTIGDPDIILSVLKEAKSVLFFVLGSIENDSQFWFLSYTDQLKILSSILIPLVQQYYAANTAMGLKPSQEALDILFDCVTKVSGSWEPYLIPLKFGLSPKVPDHNDPKFVDFKDKIFGIIQRFCISSDSDLSLQILQSLSHVLHSQPNQLIPLMEDTLRSYLTHFPPSSTSGFHNCLSVLQLPPVSTNTILHILRSKHLQAPLYIRLLLEQNKIEMLKKGEGHWIEFVMTIIEPLLQFEPPKHRIFEILVLWFFIFESIADYRFPINGRTIETVDLFKMQLNSGDMDFITKKIKITKRSFLEISDDSGAIYLASKAIFIFLCRIISSKSTNSVVSEELETAYSSLLSLKDQQKFHNYAHFFEEMKDINSALMTLPKFETTLVKTLYPIAPYLVKIIDLNEDDLTSIKKEEGLDITSDTLQSDPDFHSSTYRLPPPNPVDHL